MKNFMPCFKSTVMSKYFHLDRRSSFPWIFVIGVVVLFGVEFVRRGQVELLQSKDSFEFLLPAVGAWAAFVHFLYTQHHQGTQTFLSLFDTFNTRYDKLNGKLNAIMDLEAGAKLSPEQIDTLYDYFNLCAEEHLFYETGYVDKTVWCAWLRGMKYFASKTVVSELWEKEIASGSYYHFKWPLLENAKCPRVEQ